MLCVMYVYLCVQSSVESLEKILYVCMYVCMYCMSKNICLSKFEWEQLLNGDYWLMSLLHMFIGLCELQGMADQFPSRWHKRSLNHAIK